jgi:hypothetical protein
MNDGIEAIADVATGVVVAKAVDLILKAGALE